jgi:hypothetical protein
MKCLQAAGLSPLLISNIYMEHSLWAKMGNQKLVHKNDEGKVTAFGTL